MAAAVAAVAAVARPAASDTQAIVGPTGSMYEGSNVGLRVPDDGSMEMEAAIATGTVTKAEIPAQNGDKTSVSRTGGGN